MKINVKDYYAMQRAKKRNASTDAAKRREIARKAAQKRWSHTIKQTLDVIK